MNPQRGTPTNPGARHEPTTGQTRPQLLFARVSPGGAAHTVLPGSRGGRPPPPGAPLLHFPFPPLRRVGSLLSQTRLRWRITEAGRLLPAHCPREDAHPASSAPEAETFTPPRGRLTSRPARCPLHLIRLSVEEPPQTHCRARNPAARRRTKSSAAGGRPPRSRHFPQPARTRAPQHFRFQTRSSFKVISVRPAGRRPPGRAPLLPSPLRRVTNKFPALCGATFPRAPRPPRPPARSPRAPGPLYDGHRLPTALPAPSPAHTKSELPGGLSQAPHRRATAGSGKPSRGAPNTAPATKARTPKGRAASSLTLVVISELVSTAASDMVGHAGDPMQRTKKTARVRRLWRKSCRSPQRWRKRAAKVAAASGEPDTGTMQRWLFRAASGELTRRQIL